MPTPIDADRLITFGQRYYGKTYAEADEGFLRWMIKVGHSEAAIAQSVLDWRKAGCPREPEPDDPLGPETAEAADDANRRRLETFQHGRLKARTGPTTMKLKPLEDVLHTAIRAAQPLLQINTAEIDEVQRAIEFVCTPDPEKDGKAGMRRQGRLAYTFDRHRGIQPLHELPDRVPKYVSDLKGKIPPPPTFALLSAFCDEEFDEGAAGGIRISHVLAVENFHVAVGPSGDPASIPAVVQNLYAQGKKERKTLIAICAPKSVLPPEIASLFQVYEHTIPDEEELRERIAGTMPADLDPEIPRRAAEALRGLPFAQAEAFVGAALTKFGKGAPAEVARQCFKDKLKLLNEEGLVELCDGRETFADVGGLAGLKKFIKGGIQATLANSDKRFRGRGVLMVGTPGAGKSLMAKAVGNECGIPTLKLNLGKLFGSLVGQTEAKTAKCFEVIQKHSPCCVLVDECEKAMPKLGRSSDGGVSDRMLGTFLQQMGDNEHPVYWLFAANSVEGMSSAMFRADRVDGTFFVGLPEKEANQAIWRMYLDIYAKDAPDAKTRHGHNVLAGQPHDGAGVDDWRALSEKSQSWTPAEIAACCRQARLHGISILEASSLIIPWSSTSAEEHKALKSWAEKCALCSITGKPYATEAVKPKATKAAAKENRRAIDHDSDFRNN